MAEEDGWSYLGDLWNRACQGSTAKLKESGQKAAPEAAEAPEVRSLPKSFQVVASFRSMWSFCAGMCNLKVVLSSPILSL